MNFRTMLYSIPALALLMGLAVGCGAVKGMTQTSTELHAAVRAGDLEGARELIASGADVDAQDDEGRTPLHLAADADNVEMIALLAENGADFNIVDQMGATPLDQADKNGSQNALWALQQLGAREQ